MIVIPHLGLFALLLLIAATTHWFFRTWQVNIPKNSIAYKIAWLTGLLMGCFAYYQSTSDPFAPWAMGVGAMMVYLVFTGGQKITGETIDVGDDLPIFSAVDEFGNNFESTQLSGKPILLKFFRGHW